MSNRDWAPQWEPRRGGGLSFGDDRPRRPVQRVGFVDGTSLDARSAPPPRVVRLDGGYEPVPVPPGGLQLPHQQTQRPIEVVEPTEGWWKKAGAFGQRFQGLPPARFGEEIALTEQLNLPGPPAPWWLSFFRFNRNQANEGTDAGNWEFRARVLYGVGGVLNQIDVDLIQGIQFPLVCNSLTVQLVTYTPTLFGSGSEAEQYDPGELAVTAGVVFGKGAGSGSLPPTYTTPWYQKGAAALPTDVLTVQVPDFARSVAVHTSTVTDSALQAFQLRFTDLGGQTLQELSLGYTEAYSLVTGEKGVPIPAGTNSVVLIMTSASIPGGTRVALQFFLAL